MARPVTQGRVYHLDELDALPTPDFIQDMLSIHDTFVNALIDTDEEENEQSFADLRIEVYEDLVDPQNLSAWSFSHSDKEENEVSPADLPIDVNEEPVDP